MGRKIELTWNCTYCNSKNLGRHSNCINCGHTRGKGIRYDMPQTIKYVDSKTEKTISKNPDWLCSFCDSLNSDKLNYCSNCGASKETSEKNYFEMVNDEEREEREEQEEQEEREILSNSSLNVDYNDNIALNDDDYNLGCLNNTKTYKTNVDDTITSYNKVHKKFDLRVILASGLLGLSVISLILFFIFLCIPREKTILVTDMSWNYNVNIEEEKPVSYSDWNLPLGARLLYTQEEIYDYEDIIVGYEEITDYKDEEVLVGRHEEVVGYQDLGNGYAEEITEWVDDYETIQVEYTYEVPIIEKEPIMATKYYYEVDEWVYTRSIKAGGYDKSEPYWPEIILEENEREQSRSQDFDIYGVDKEKDIKVEYDVDNDMWQDIEIGDTLKLKVNTLGYIDSYEILE